MWSTEFPQEEGWYWFCGYRYGKMWGDRVNKPELIFVEVSKCVNGLMYAANGTFMFKSEVEEPHFQKAILPKLPKGMEL